MKVIKTLEFSTRTRNEVYRVDFDDIYRAQHLYKLIQGQNMNYANKVADIKLARTVLGCSLKQGLIFVEDAYTAMS